MIVHYNERHAAVLRLHREFVERRGFKLIRLVEKVIMRQIGIGRSSYFAMLNKRPPTDYDRELADEYYDRCVTAAAQTLRACDVIEPIAREYSYSQNGDLTESDGAELYTYCNALLISHVLIFHRWKNRRDYGSSISLYKDVNLSTCVTAIIKAQNDEFDAFFI
jgi:hypothetical protein